jgi:hypothetical protein
MSGPWLKFYPSDWRADPALRMCSIAARGLWIEMLCIMHEADGSLLVNGKQLTPRQLAVLTGTTPDEVKELMVELSDAGVFSRDEHGTIYSRRMKADIVKAETDKANGKKGGNPALKDGVNPPDNPTPKRGDKAQKPEARDQNSSDASASGAAAPVDHRAELFDRGLKIVIRKTGRAEPQARSQIGRWLKAVNDEAVFVLAALDDAVLHDVADLSSWVEAAIRQRGQGPPHAVANRSVQATACALQQFVRGADEPDNVYPLLPAASR